MHLFMQIRTIQKLTPYLAATLILCACTNGGDPQASLAQAKVHLAQSGQQAAAVIELKNALQANPDLAEARFLLGKTYLEQGSLAASEIELRKALALKYDPDQTIPALVRGMLGQKLPEKVLTEFKNQTLQSDEAKADLLSLLGGAHLSLGQFDAAMEKFQATQKIKPGYPEAMLGEGHIFAARGDLAQAHARVDNVLAASPKHVSALLLKGDLYRSSNQFDQALAIYETAAAEQPNNFSVHFALANTYAALNNDEALQAQINAMKRISPKHPGTYYFDALLAFNAKQYPKAREIILQSLAVTPGNVQSLLLAGTVTQLLNEPIQSEHYLKQALTQAPYNIYALKQLASLYLGQKEPLKAEEPLKLALKISPNNPDLLNLAGNAAIAQGRFNDASRFYNQATAIAQANPRATQNAAIQISKQGIPGTTADISPNDLAQVLAHLDKKEYDQALKSWQTLQNKYPNNPLTYNLQATIYLGKGDVTSARKALEQAVKIQPTYFPAASNLANLDLRDKKPDSARQRYQAILDKEPNNLRALLALAELMHSTGGSKPEQLKLLDQARRSNPDSSQPILALVQFHLESGDMQQALATTKEALAKSPNNQQLLDIAGRVQLRAGQATQAVETYSRLVADNPKQAQWLVRLGEAQIKAGRFEAGNQSLSKALQLQPDDIEVQINAVSAYLNANKSDDALRMVEQIKKLAPKSSALPQLEGNVRMAKREFAAAADSYKKAYAPNPSTVGMIKIHQALLLARNKTEANKVLTDWLKTNPADDKAQLYAADLAMSAKEYPQAVPLYQKLMLREPGNALVLNNLAWASYQIKDPKALSYAEKAYAVAPNSLAVMDTLGWILTEQGQLKRGIELLEKASGQAPKQWDIKLHLAKALIKDGRKDAARELLQAIVKAESGSPTGKESAQLLTGL